MAEHQITIEEAQTNLLACAAFTAESIKSSDGYALAMKEIVPRYLEKNEVDFAAELANSVDDPFTRDRLLMLVAEKCAAIGDDEYAFQLVEAIEDYSSQAQARSRIVFQKAAKGEFEKALEIVETLDHPDNALVDVALQQAASGMEENAEATAARIDFPHAKVTALQNLAALNLEKGNFEKAVELLEKAVEAAREIEFSEEKVSALTVVADYFAEAKRNDKAIETLDEAKSIAEILDNIHRDSFLANVALGFLQAGSLELADRTLDLVTDKTQITAALVGFAVEFQEKGEGEAFETLEESYAILKSQRDGEIRDSQARFGLWATIAVEFARFEKADRAIEIAQEIPDENSQNTALAQIAQICAFENKDELARQAVNAIAGDERKMFALVGISDAKNKLEKRDEALNALREAETLCESVPQLASRSAAYNELAARFHSFGDAEKTRALLHENLETIADIRDESSRVVALAQLSDLHEKFGFDLTDAEKEITLAVIRRAEM